MKKHLAALVLVAAILAPIGISAGGDGETEYRLHYRIAHSDRTLAADATAFTSLKEHRSDNVFLIRTAAGTRFRVDRAATYASAAEEIKFTDLDSGESLTVRHIFPVAGGNRSEVIAQIRNIDARAKSRAQLIFKSRGKAVHTTEAELDSGSGVADEIRNLLSGDFVVKLQQLQPILTYPAFLNTCRALDGIFAETSCSPDTGLQFGATDPDCAFDGEMGMPCTAMQIEGVERMRKSGRSKRAY